MNNIEIKSCYLKSNENVSALYLPDKQSVVLGRSLQTQIINKKCSKRQLEIVADYSNAKVTVKQIGKRASGFNGFKTVKGLQFIGKHGDRIEMLYGQYHYDIEFNPPPPSIIMAEKRSRESEPRASPCKIPRVSEDSVDPNPSTSCPSVSLSGSEERQMQSGSGNNLGGILRYFNRVTSSDMTTETWDSICNDELLIFMNNRTDGRSKIAAYDMDGTLILTRSGNVFPRDCNDWQLFSPVVPEKIRKLYNEGYKIVVFTNQAAIGSKKLDKQLFKNKLKNITEKIGVPMQIFVATGRSIFRKPAIGMWQKLEEQYNDSVPIDKENSFYVGDAAGRPKLWAPQKKKDHSSADRLLALNLSLRFYTPEEHFLGHKKAPFVLPAFNPKNLPNLEICVGGNLCSDTQEVILMVGCPASGKSHFARNYLKTYGYVNRDTLGTWQKCLSLMEEFLKEKKSVVVDNTNYDCTTRRRYLEVAKKYNVPTRCFIMTTGLDHARHNNQFRELTDPRHVKITPLILNTYMKNFEKPNLDEGLAEIVEVNFLPSFENEEQRKLYEMYLLEN